VETVIDVIVIVDTGGIFGQVVGEIILVEELDVDTELDEVFEGIFVAPMQEHALEILAGDKEHGLAKAGMFGGGVESRYSGQKASAEVFCSEMPSDNYLHCMRLRQEHTGMKLCQKVYCNFERKNSDELFR